MGVNNSQPVTRAGEPNKVTNIRNVFGNRLSGRRSVNQQVSEGETLHVSNSENNPSALGGSNTIEACIPQTIRSAANFIEDTNTSIEHSNNILARSPSLPHNSVTSANTILNPRTRIQTQVIQGGESPGLRILVPTPRSVNTEYISEEVISSGIISSNPVSVSRSGCRVFDRGLEYDVADGEATEGGVKNLNLNTGANMFTATSKSMLSLIGNNGSILRDSRAEEQAIVPNIGNKIPKVDTVFCCLIKSKTREHNKRKESKKSIWFEGKPGGIIKIGSDKECGLVLKDDRCEKTHAIIRYKSTVVENMLKNDLVLYPCARMYRLISPQRHNKLSVGTVVKIGSISLEIINLNVNTEEDDSSYTFLEPYTVTIYSTDDKVVKNQENGSETSTLRVRFLPTVASTNAINDFNETTDDMRKLTIVDSEANDLYGREEDDDDKDFSDAQEFCVANSAESNLLQNSQGNSPDFAVREIVSSKKDSGMINDSSNEESEVAAESTPNTIRGVRGSSAYRCSLEGIKEMNETTTDSLIKESGNNLCSDTSACKTLPLVQNPCVYDVAFDDVMCYICWSGVDLMQHSIVHEEKMPNEVINFDIPRASGSSEEVKDEIGNTFKMMHENLLKASMFTSSSNPVCVSSLPSDIKLSSFNRGTPQTKVFNPIIKNPCNTCAGGSQFVHFQCLMRWIKTSKSGHCSICNNPLPAEFCAKPPNLELKIIRHRRGQHWVGTRRFRLSFAEVSRKTLGSSFRSDIRLPDCSVSDIHCVIKYCKRRKEFFIIDNLSKGGTYLQLTEPVVLNETYDMGFTRTAIYGAIPQVSVIGVNEFKIGRSSLTVKVVQSREKKNMLLKMLQRGSAGFNGSNRGSLLSSNNIEDNNDPSIVGNHFGEGEFVTSNDNMSELSDYGEGMNSNYDER